MNEIIIRGYLRDIEFSHMQNNVEYEKANLICPRVGCQDEDVISVRYRKDKVKYKENDFVELKGNIRSYSQKFNDNTSNVQIYVFTYFDEPTEVFANKVILDGRICKKDILRVNKNGKKYIHFILANNIYVNGGKRLNSYIPCTCYNEVAELVESLNINDCIEVDGKLQSHVYKKYFENNELEYRLAHEVVIDSLKKVDLDAKRVD